MNTRGRSLTGRCRGPWLRAALGVALALSARAEGPETGSLHGRLVDAESGEPLRGAVVRIADTHLGAWADEIVTYRIQGLPSGPHAVEAPHVGYYLRKVPGYWFRLLPSLGVSWGWGC